MQSSCQHYILDTCRQIAVKLKSYFITYKGFYLIRLLVVGVTDAVGEDERDSCGEVVPIAMRDAGDPPSGALISRLISSLLLRDTVVRNVHVFNISNIKSTASETTSGNPYMTHLLHISYLRSTTDLEINSTDKICIRKQTKFDECI